MLAGINPELLILLDVRVEQLHLEVGDKGHVEIKVEGMKCLQCEGIFDCYVGDSYLCRKCEGPYSRAACELGSL